MKLLLLLGSLLVPCLLDAATAEIKMLVDEKYRSEAMKLLAVKAEGMPETRICFFDTPDGLLDRQHLILRFRVDTKPEANGARDADAVVKLRGSRQAPQGYTHLQREMDWTGPQSSKPSYSIKVENLPEAEVTQVLEGKLAPRDLLTAEQQNFANACLKEGGGGEVPWTALQRYGVISAWKSKREIGEFSKVTVETWKCHRVGKSPLELLEISVKINAETDSEAAAKAKAFYAAAAAKGLGVPTGASKTSRIIEFFKP